MESIYGSIDSFITSEPTDRIVEKLSYGTSPYKLKMMGGIGLGVSEKCWY